jgi:hypothetical protein
MPISIGNKGTVIRYNISQNDGEYKSGPIFEFTGSVQDATIYNNVVYIGSDLDILLINTWAWGGGLPDNTRFYNNIFYVDGQARFNILPGTTNSVFENNVWYGKFVNKPNDSSAITSDPMLVNPGSGKNGFESLDGYKLKENSPCIGKGKSLGVSGLVDFWGNKIPELIPCIGLHEKKLTARSTNSCNTFYVNNVTGNDNNSGTSRSKAWASLDKVNSVVFKPGDKILFKAGTVHTGQLKPTGSGKEGAPIIIDKYGAGSKPRIDGKGLHVDTVLLENVEYWEVNNLEITNLAPERMKGQSGITVSSNGFGTMHHIHLKNLYVHDVNGHLIKSDSAEQEGHGICGRSIGDKPSRFDDLLIEDCHVVRTDRNGICMRSDFTDRDKNWFPSLNVVIRGNLVEDCGGDGIKPWGVDGCLVEYNTVDGARQRCTSGAAGIWPWSSDNAIFQYNEACNVKGTKDGQGFDSDYNSRNTLFQYNYSHDNEGGFMLVCTMPVEPANIGNINTIIRYNISQNDMERIFHLAGEVRNTHIYNNVIYTKEGIDIPLALFADWRGKYPIDTYFYNNIFYTDGKFHYAHKTKRLGDGRLGHAPGFAKSTNTVFSNNVYYGNHVNRPHDPYAITSDPMLVNPGSGSNGLNTLDGYKLKAGSPCIGAGKAIAETGVLDFWANKINKNKPSIGVHEKVD